MCVFWLPLVDKSICRSLFYAKFYKLIVGAIFCNFKKYGVPLHATFEVSPLNPIRCYFKKKLRLPN